MHTIRIKGKLVDFSTPWVMGIVNITPDSFYDGGKYPLPQQILNRCEQILAEGGGVIDIGAFSSKPGVCLVSEEEELARLMPVLALIRERFPLAVLSVDTYRSVVAKRAVEEYGVDIINDISGGVMDSNMLSTIATLQVPYVMMHMQGTPQNMQQAPNYSHLIQDISLFFSQQLDKCHRLGITDVIIDPGFGFGKTVAHNYQLLQELKQFSLLNCSILVGLSRKSMISKVLNCDSEQALNGTSVLNTVALLNGANILRVHDVKQAVECVTLVQQLNAKQ